MCELRQGCAAIEHRKSGTVRYLIRGRVFKDQRDKNGRCVTEGVDRKQPWVTVSIAHTAVRVAERVARRLNPRSDMLFPRPHPVSPYVDGESDKGIPNDGDHYEDDELDLVAKGCRAPSDARRMCAMLLSRELDDPTAGDGKTIGLARFRRTLAWHIARRPRGLIALGVQYGHVRLATTQGYARRDRAFQQEISRQDGSANVERIHRALQRRKEGEKVSGPAANRYSAILETAAAIFEGEVIPRDDLVLRMQRSGVNGIYVDEKSGVVCQYSYPTSACQRPGAPALQRRTPNLSQCQDSCGNIVRTDQNIEYLMRQAHSDIQRVVNNLKASEYVNGPLSLRMIHSAGKILGWVDRHHQAITSQGAVVDSRQLEIVVELEDEIAVLRKQFSEDDFVTLEQRDTEDE